MNASPQEASVLDAGGVKTRYHEAGEGPPVVLIHGSGPGVSAWANWRLTIPALAQRFHVYAPDVLGFGYTERPPGVRYGKRAWVDHVVAFIQAAGLSRAHLVGNSMGGALALAIAAERPDLVDRLVLMGSVGVEFPLTEGLAAVWGYRPSEAAMRRLVADYFAFDASLASDDLVRLRYQASVEPGFQEAFEAMFPEPLQRHIAALATDEAAIRQVVAPTLIIHGRDDKVVPLATSWRLLELLPNARLHVFGRCGHWTQIEHTAEFNALVGHFLASD
jgi:2-hydroxymuconate-semialdehyde hydrolase